MTKTISNNCSTISSNMKRISRLPAVVFLIILFNCFILPSFSQPFTPVALNGFNHDVIAEAGNSSLTTTTISLDGFTVSNKVMYTNTFKTLNGFGGGGIADNGLITDASGTYQLADYTGNNALLIQRSQSGELNITTPAAYSRIRLLCFSTEGSSLVNVALHFTDGSTTNALTNYSVGDWFNNTNNLVLSGFGRCTRATPASGADAYPGNPRMYYIDIPISCTDRQKNLDKIQLANVTTAGSNAPYPNAVFFAVSAIPYSLNVTDNITDASCTVNGSVTLNITGSGSPYNVTWNTTPAQSGLSATNLLPGPYTASISDAAGCISQHPVTIGQNNNLFMLAHIDTPICYNASFNANTNSNATSYSWSPTTGVSDPNSANPVLSPTAPSTMYTVTGTLGTCPPIVRTFTVTVSPQITLNIPPSLTVCTDSSVIPVITSNATSFQWLPTQGVSNTTIANPVLSPDATTTYSITATTGLCSVNGNLLVSVAPKVNAEAGNGATIAAGQTVQLNGSGDAGNYSWSPAGSLSVANIPNPVASPTSTTQYTLVITNAAGCSGSDVVEIHVIPECAKPMEAITPNGDGINDKWLVTYGNCITAAKVKVFNRYGSSVFEAENYQNNWEGTYKGKTLPDATYYYVIEYRQANNITVMLKGNLTIIR